MMMGAERPPRDAEAGTWEKTSFGKARNIVKSSIEAEAPAARCGLIWADNCHSPGAKNSRERGKTGRRHWRE
jgi:hypothetical protein